MKPHEHKLPVLGSFCRPSDRACEKLTGAGYGMPSGHSQIACFIPAFYYFYYRGYEDFSMEKFAIMSAVALFIMYTRYTSKKHSIQQIIIGGLYGTLIAFVFARVFGFLGIL